MKVDKKTVQKVKRDLFISIFLYTTPILLMFLSFYLSGARPGQTNFPTTVTGNDLLSQIFQHLNTWGLPAIMVVIGIVELAYGLYENHWTKNERILDIVCFIVPKLVVRPTIAYFGLKFLPMCYYPMEKMPLRGFLSGGAF